MKIKLKKFLSLILPLIGFNLSSIAVIPHPDHVIVLVLENTSYNQIVGSNAAPYINSLINDPMCALFTQSYGMTRPSQPNYLQLFSGSTQGVTSNSLPAGLPFTTPNLGKQLLNASKTFMGYSESMPSVGYTGEVSGSYVRKHNPWVNWQNSPTNGLPASVNETYLAFPNSSNYSSLPHFSFVVPNQDNDMHNGTYPTRVTNGDTWVQNNMNALIQWVKTHNSLFIITFDEDDYVDQHIVTLFIGPMVNHGSYSNTINHYNMLGLFEDMFNLPRIGGAIAAAPIDYCWKPCYQLSEITASGPVTFCQGESVNLSAAGGVSFLWSNGATTQSISVNTSGNYSVTINDGAGCTSTSAPVSVTVNNFNYSANVFSETMGTVGGTTTIAVHETGNGFDNDIFAMSGTGDIRTNSNSTAYANASGGANVYLTNTIGRFFQIENINTSTLSLANVQLSFGIFKSATAGTGMDLLVQYSTDGINYSPLTFDPLPTGTGTSQWYYRTASGTIPAVSNLRIKFIQNGSVSQYRIDDVLLKYSYTSAQIVANGPVIFCQGANVILNATSAVSYQWSNGASTQSITVSEGGSYHVVETGANGCTSASNIIPVTVNSAPVVNGFLPTSGTEGEIVTINGSNFSGATAVHFNGVSASFTINSSIQITATVPAGNTAGFITVTNNCGNGNSLQSFGVNIDPSVLNLKIFIEGYYTGGGEMISLLGGTVCDSVTIELCEMNAPFNVLYYVKGVISTTGEGSFVFPYSVKGDYFYIVVYGRNSNMTFSKYPVLFSESTSYYFTDSVSAAYGDNLIETFDNMGWAIYSGDINNDGAIDGFDFLELDASIQNGEGDYIVYDLNGDGGVDGNDFLLLDPNIQMGIGTAFP